MQCDKFGKKLIRSRSLGIEMNLLLRSKLMSELMIQDFAKASNSRYMILRYFNVAVTDSSGKLGQ
jgi:UDP-glucose 4-epimerase